MHPVHKLSTNRIGYPARPSQFYGTLRSCGASEKTKKMKSLDFAAMENIQGGSAGNFSINLPISSLLSILGLGSLLGIGLGIGLGVSYNIEGLTIPSLPLGL
jgi:hypothetical protein